MFAALLVMMKARRLLIFNGLTSRFIIVRHFLMLVFFILLQSYFAANSARAQESIHVTNLSAAKLAWDQFQLHAEIENRTEVDQEVVFRAQITFYDRSAPVGDLPVSILRKDFIKILKVREKKVITVDLINEGSAIPGAVRMEPMLRVRREREWNY